MIPAHSSNENTFKINSEGDRHSSESAQKSFCHRTCDKTYVIALRFQPPLTGFPLELGIIGARDQKIRMTKLSDGPKKF